MRLLPDYLAKEVGRKMARGQLKMLKKRKPRDDSHQGRASLITKCVETWKLLSNRMGVHRLFPEEGKIFQEVDKKIKCQKCCFSTQKYKNVRFSAWQDGNRALSLSYAQALSH
jgi:hypothetical protein